MGKALLILVFSVSLSGSVLVAQMHEGSVERARRTSTQARAQLAQDVAHSGYALGAQRLERQYAPFSEVGVRYGDGAYDIQAQSMADGRMELWASGFVNQARYDLRGEFVQLNTPCNLLGAVFLNAQASPVVTAAGTGFQIRGEDTRPPSRTGGSVVVDGPGYTVAGILADTLVSDAFSIPIAGIAGLEASVTLGGVTDEGYLRSLIGCLLATAAEVADGAAAPFAGDRHFVSQTFGSVAAPVLTVIEGDARFTGTTRGYGVLLVGGDLLAEDDFVWEGMVMAFGDSLATVALSDGARIYGGLVGGGIPTSTSVVTGIVSEVSPFADLSTLLESYLDGGGSVLGTLDTFRRPMAFAVADSAGVFHSEEALGRLQALLPTIVSTGRTDLLNERFGIAAAP